MDIVKRRALFSTLSPPKWEGMVEDVLSSGLRTWKGWVCYGICPWSQTWHPPERSPSSSQPHVWGQDADFSCGCKGPCLHLGSFILISSLSWTQALFFQIAVFILFQVLFLGSLLLEALDVRHLKCWRHSMPICVMGAKVPRASHTKTCACLVKFKTSAPLYPGEV